MPTFKRDVFGFNGINEEQKSEAQWDDELSQQILPPQRSYGGLQGYTGTLFNRVDADGVPLVNMYRQPQTSHMYSEAYSGLPHNRTHPQVVSTEFNHVPRPFIRSGTQALAPTSGFNRGPFFAEGDMDESQESRNGFLYPSSTMNLRNMTDVDGSMLFRPGPTATSKTTRNRRPPGTPAAKTSTAQRPPATPAAPEKEKEKEKAAPSQTESMFPSGIPPELSPEQGAAKRAQDPHFHPGIKRLEAVRQAFGFMTHITHRDYLREKERQIEHQLHNHHDVYLELVSGLPRSSLGVAIMRALEQIEAKRQSSAYKPASDKDVVGGVLEEEKNEPYRASQIIAGKRALPTQEHGWKREPDFIENAHPIAEETKAELEELYAPETKTLDLEAERFLALALQWVREFGERIHHDLPEDHVKQFIRGTSQTEVMSEAIQSQTITGPVQSILRVFCESLVSGDKLGPDVLHPSLVLQIKSAFDRIIHKRKKEFGGELFHDDMLSAQQEYDSGLSRNMDATMRVAVEHEPSQTERFKAVKKELLGGIALRRRDEVDEEQVRRAGGTPSELLDRILKASKYAREPGRHHDPVADNGDSEEEWET